jgi:hypothetical protein
VAQIQHKGGTTMELTFALENGMRAGVRPTEDVRDAVAERRCIEESAPDQDLAVIFHVRNKQAVDRVMERFGASGC